MLSLSRSEQERSSLSPAATEAATQCVAGLALARGSQTLLLSAIIELSISASPLVQDSTTTKSIQPLVERLEEILSRRIMEITHPIENGKERYDFSFFFLSSLSTSNKVTACSFY
jgi:hypothetical protein